MTTREFLLTTWGWHPAVAVTCVVALLTYTGAVHFRSPGRSGCFIAAILIFYLTLASPISALANGYLFSAHMLQHLLLLLVVPALALLGLPDSKHHHGIRVPPFLLWLAGLSAMWVWHERTLCNAAATTPAVRTIQTISLVALGLLFGPPSRVPMPNAACRRCLASSIFSRRASVARSSESSLRSRPSAWFVLPSCILLTASTFSH